MDPDALDSPPRLRQTLLLSFSFFFCFFFVADPEPCAKEGFGAKNTENNTQHNNNSRSILWKRKKKKRENKKHSTACVDTVFTRATPEPLENKSPGLCSLQVYIL